MLVDVRVVPLIFEISKNTETSRYLYQVYLLRNFTISPFFRIGMAIGYIILFLATAHRRNASVADFQSLLQRSSFGAIVAPLAAGRDFYLLPF